jgi:hypothetical protein
MTRKIGPHSTHDVLVRMDKRTKPARLLKEIRRKLFEHLAEVGIPKPSIVQEEIIERAAWLRLHIALADAKAANGYEMTDISRRSYLAWTNNYQKALMRLDIASEPEQDATPSELSEYISALAEVSAERREVAA